MYVLVVKSCTGHVGQMTLEKDQVFDAWATYSDQLLLGEQLTVEIPNAPADSHIESVSIFWDEPITTTGQPARQVICSVFLLCSHDVQVEKDKAVRSRLYLPRKA